MEIARLAALPLFAALDFEQAGRLAPYAAELLVPRGGRLLLDGPFGSDLIVIEAGRAQVRFAGEPVAELGPDDFFGALGVVHPAWPTATVTALSDMTLVSFGVAELRRLRRESPETLAMLLDAMDAGRLRLRGRLDPMLVA